MVIKLTQVEL